MCVFISYPGHDYPSDECEEGGGGHCSGQQQQGVHQSGAAARVVATGPFQC